MKVDHFLERVWYTQTVQRRVSISVCKNCNDKEIGDYVVLKISGNFKMRMIINGENSGMKVDHFLERVW